MVIIKKINDTFSISLVGMLNDDNLLQHALGSKNNNISKEEFIKYNNEWCKSKNAEIFAILLNNTPIGMISLSHQDTGRQSAQLGYWIGSEYWGKGFTSMAFSQVLDYAKKRGLKHIGANIEDDNFASKRIWEKNGAKMELINNRCLASIIL